MAHLFAGCLLWMESAQAEDHIRLAILPLETINLSPREGTRYQNILERALRKYPHLALYSVSSADRALSTQLSGCAAEINCLRDAGTRLGVEKLLALRVGRLSDTIVVRLAVFDVRRGVRQGTWQEVLRRADEPAVAQAMNRMLASFIPPPPSRRPWYSRWWVWTATAAVIGGSLTAALLATRDRKAEPDFTIIPPAR